MPVLTPALFEKLDTLRRGYPPMMTTAQAADLLNRTLFGAPGFGMLSKTSGNHAVIPGTDTKISVDWIVRLDGIGGDCLGDGPDGTTTPETLGRCVPQNAAGEPYDTSRFVAPVKPADVPDVPGDPDPGPGDPNLPALAEKVARLTGVVERLVDVVGELTTRVEAVEGLDDKVLAAVDAAAEAVKAVGRFKDVLDLDLPVKRSGFTLGHARGTVSLKKP